MSGSQTIRIPQQVTESFKRGRFTEPSTGCRDPQKAVQGPGGWRQEEVAEPREWPREQRREPREMAAVPRGCSPRQRVTANRREVAGCEHPASHSSHLLSGQSLPGASPDGKLEGRPAAGAARRREAGTGCGGQTQAPHSLPVLSPPLSPSRLPGLLPF